MGKGTITQEEADNARRKIATQFMTTHEKDLWIMAPDFDSINGTGKRVDALIQHPEFEDRLRRLENRERALELGGSKGMYSCLFKDQPALGRRKSRQKEPAWKKNDPHNLTKPFGGLSGGEPNATIVTARSKTGRRLRSRSELLHTRKMRNIEAGKKFPVPKTRFTSHSNARKVLVTELKGIERLFTNMQRRQQLQEKRQRESQARTSQQSASRQQSRRVFRSACDCCLRL